MTHEHRHPNQPDTEDSPIVEYRVMAQAVSELLMEKGVFTAAAARAMTEALSDKKPGNGARMIARGWLDPAYEARVLASVNEAAPELGYDPGTTRIIAVRNTPDVHNVIVCTLCSCYPVSLLGASPDWYKSRAYRSRVVREPRAVLAEFGTHIADHVTVRVHDSSADLRYLVIPMRPAGTEAKDEAELASLITRDCMIGTALPKVPGQ